MTLEEKIYQDYVSAMKARDKARSDFLNFIRADIKNAAIAAKKDKLDDNEVLSVISKQKKKLEDAKEIAGSAKEDFIKEVDFQIAILNEYLPKVLSDEELAAVVSQAISDTGAATMKDMGRVMKEVLAKVGVRAEPKKINEIVRAKLTN